VEQQITEILQIPAENVTDVVKSNGVTIPFWFEQARII